MPSSPRSESDPARPLAAHWFHLSAVFLPWPLGLTRGSGTSTGFVVIWPSERRAEKRLPKRSILRKKRFTSFGFPLPGRANPYLVTPSVMLPT